MNDNKKVLTDAREWIEKALTGHNPTGTFEAMSALMILTVRLSKEADNHIEILKRMQKALDSTCDELADAQNRLDALVEKLRHAAADFEAHGTSADSESIYAAKLLKEMG